MRRYNDYNRKKSAEVRLAAALSRPTPEYQCKRQRGEIIKRINGVELIVVLIPKGNCTQWLAVFPDGKTVFGGLNKIDAECRRRMPPANAAFVY